MRGLKYDAATRQLISAARDGIIIAWDFGLQREQVGVVASAVGLHHVNVQCSLPGWCV